jgi:hypothetical protein
MPDMDGNAGLQKRNRFFLFWGDVLLVFETCVLCQRQQGQRMERQLWRRGQLSWEVFPGGEFFMSDSQQSGNVFIVYRRQALARVRVKRQGGQGRLDTGQGRVAESKG